MKKQYLIYALLCIYGCPLVTMESDAKTEQTEQNANTNTDATTTTTNTTATKKPTFGESWRKVATLRWRELGRADAWNIGAPVTAIAAIGLWYYNSPNNPPQPPVNNFNFNNNNNPGGNNIPNNIPNDDNPLFDRINELRRQHGIPDNHRFSNTMNELYRQQREQEEQARQQRAQEQWQRNQQQEADDLAEAIRRSLADSENNVPSEEQPTIVNQPAQAECIMCLETLPCTTMPCCQSMYCPECLIEYVRACLHNNNTRELLCPNNNCAHRQIEESTMRIITWLTNGRKDLYDRYIDIANNEYLDKQGEAIKQCPTPNCNNRIIIDSERNRQFAHCQGCNQQRCSHCLLNHANNITCAQAARDLEIAQNPTLAEQANQEFIRNNTKQCPNCRHGIEKNGGCNHMTCKNCRHEFCWTCSARYGSTRCNSAGCITQAGFIF